jgi:GNAT superfamily N-acetyltransferase
MAETFTLALASTPDEANRAFILEHLKAFNDAHSPTIRASRLAEHAAQPLQIYVRDTQQQLWGGIIASTIWTWLDIDLFWLDEHLRGQDYGTRLIQMAEAEARRRGCFHSKVGTWSFQARGFYEKMGYHVVGQIDDFPPGATDYTLVKDLTPER